MVSTCIHAIDTFEQSLVLFIEAIDTERKALREYTDREKPSSGKALQGPKLPVVSVGHGGHGAGA
jgi:hypothetical protein